MTSAGGKHGTLTVATALPRGLWAVHEMQIAVVARVAGSVRTAPVRGVIGNVQNWHTPQTNPRQKVRITVEPYPRARGPASLDGRFDSGGATVLFELILQNLPVEGAAADFEHSRCFLLVPRHRFQYPQDVGAFRVPQ